MATPKSSSGRKPAGVTAKKSPGQTPLFSSRAAAEKAKAGLRRGRNDLESARRVGDTDIRSSLI